jgi:hypothetical protein
MPAVNGVGEPCAGKPHARFDAAGAGNGAIRHRASPRPYTGKVVKSSAPACLQHLNAHYPENELPDLFRGMAAATGDAFDAAVSALEMARARDALRRLPDGDDIDRIEGRIWSHLP